MHGETPVLGGLKAPQDYPLRAVYEQFIGSEGVYRGGLVAAWMLCVDNQLAQTYVNKRSPSGKWCEYAVHFHERRRDGPGAYP